MSTAALITMVLSVTGVTALVVWCYCRVLRSPPPS
jgi:hypothetical protein